MDTVLEKFLSDINFSVEDGIVVNPGIASIRLDVRLFPLIREAIYSNAFYYNSISKENSSLIEMSFRDRVKDNWCSVKILVDATEGTGTELEARFVGYDTVTPDGSYILTDSLKSKSVLGW